MEDSWKLRPSLFCGCGSFLEEGAPIAGRSCSGQIALRTVSVER
jgi:hypothetical protein